MRPEIPCFAFFLLMAGCGDREETSEDADADTGGDAQVDRDSGSDTDADPGFDYNTDIPVDMEIEEADYYVAVDGDDADPGTMEEPFATIQHAHDVAGPGDLIYVRGGTYTPTEQTVFRGEGTEAEPITLRTYPGEHVIIDASGLPEGDVDGASTATWTFNDAGHWQIIGPMHLTSGRGAGVEIQGETADVDFIFIESSHNGLTASRGGHGFHIVEAEWADVSDVRFINCDAHHNANHRTIEGEPVAENLYQHGDGWRIKSGVDVQLIGCRAWNNLDDGYDLTQAADPVILVDCWAALTGYDDAEGSMTGTPSWAAEWGEGIKLTYDTDTGRHQCIRCLSWKNVHLGYRMDGGPVTLLSCASFQNGRRALGWDLGSFSHVLTNCLDYDTYRESDIPSTTTSTYNTWDETTGVTVAADDFVSLDDSGMLGPRAADGSLPSTDFLRLAAGSDLIDAGIDVGLEYNGSAPDLGCFESP
jgi:hypothetical protein